MGAHLERYFKDCLSRSDQWKETAETGGRQTWGKFEAQKWEKGSNIVRSDRAAYGNPK